MNDVADTKKLSLLNRFYWPIGLATFLTVGYVVLTFFFTFPFSIDEAGVRKNITSLMDKVPEGSIPPALTSLGEVDIQLRDGGVFMYAKLDAQVLGKQVQATMIAIGEPVYRGPGFFGSLYEAFTDDVLVKDIVYNFYDFKIDPDTFMIDGQPAVVAATPAGQRVVQSVAEDTLIGNLVVGGLNLLGKDTSDEARDAWTAKTMLVYREPLINMFSQYIENNIDNKVLYTFGENDAEQVFVSVFKGFEVSDGKFTVVFFVANLFMAIGVAIFVFFFGPGWWGARAYMTARDKGLVPDVVSDEVAGAVGEIIDS